ncbi:cytochrome [Sesamum angolense]|uniref:Cytochrome n=1 Tax=Sesamum angolense TaxID=2727404 RepID=A0AAE2C7K6_9LAMI|nr:cytochrome [Sesamum angolense]
MGSVFGKRYDPTEDAEEFRVLNAIVKEGFELLGVFNWSDYLPWLSYFYDPSRIVAHCEALVPRVRKLVKAIIEQHQLKNQHENNISDNADFVDVLLSLDGDEKLNEDDMIAVLWAIFCVFYTAGDVSDVYNQLEGTEKLLETVAGRVVSALTSQDFEGQSEPAVHYKHFS